MPLAAPPSAPARPGRRAVTSGLAWSVPVVVVGAAAPKAAASPCPPQAYLLDWSGAGGTTYSRSSATSGTVTIDPDGAGPVLPVVMAITTVFTGDMANSTGTGAPANLTVGSEGIGGTGAVGLCFHQAVTTSRNSTQPQRSARQTMTFSFTTPVTNLRFSIADIDSAANDFIDRVELSAGATVTRGVRVLGSGTQADPLRPSSNDYPVPNTSGDGNADVVFAGPVSTFTMVYWNATTTRARFVDPDQWIYLTNFRFDVVRNTC